MQKLVSIIIPFFNEEARLSRAILSAVNQTYSNIEIILINDGSTDNSQAIAEEIISDFSFVKLYTIPNSGLSVARNLGIEKCNGYYISFLDADDELESIAIEKMVSEMEKTDSCLAISKFYLKKENNDLISISGWKSKERIITNEEGIQKMYSNEITFTAWAKLFKTTLSKKIKFPPDLWFEDRPYLFQYLLNSKKICFVNDPLLSIYTRNNSITRKSISEKRILDIQKIWEIELEIAETKKLANSVLNLITRNHINFLYETIIILSIDNPPNLTSLKKLFSENIIETKTAIKRLNIPLKSTYKFHLQFMHLAKIFPWRFFYFLLKKFKSKQFETISILRQKTD